RLDTAGGDELPDAVLNFARGWGILATDVTVAEPLSIEPYDDGIFRKTTESLAALGEGEWLRQPITTWKRLTKQANLILILARYLREGKVGRDEDWLTAYTHRPRGLMANFWVTPPYDFARTVPLVRPADTDQIDAVGAGRYRIGHLL